MAKFISRCRNQVLTIKPQRTQIFDGIAQTVPGDHIRFENGEFTVDERSEEGKKKADFIRGHRLFGNQIFEEKKAKGAG